MSAIFCNTYDGVKVEGLKGIEGEYDVGAKVDFTNYDVPNSFILAQKYFFDEPVEFNQYIYLLFRNGKYINYFTRLDKIKGDFPVYENSNKPQKDWLKLKLKDVK